MTVTTESQVTLPAYLVQAGGHVWCDRAQDWLRVLYVRHTTGTPRGWLVTLELDSTACPWHILSPYEDVQAAQR